MLYVNFEFIQHSSIVNTDDKLKFGKKKTISLHPFLLPLKEKNAKEYWMVQLICKGFKITSSNLAVNANLMVNSAGSYECFTKAAYSAELGNNFDC